MSLPSFFRLTEEPTKEVVELLQRTQLGTNGAQYRHLDTEKRVTELVNPLFLFIQRHDKVLGNITFCRRLMPNGKTTFYIRYFAFDAKWSSSGKRSNKSSENSILRKGLDIFFSDAFAGNCGAKPDLFYAYIEPRNARSLWMAESFDFKVLAEINTFSFSRFFPRESTAVRQLNEQEVVEYGQMLNQTYGEHSLYFPHHTIKDKPIYGYFENGKMTAACKVHIVNWEIIRLPGKTGAVLAKVIPFIPLLNRLIRPKSHRFAVIEGLVASKANQSHITALFESILADTQTNLMLFWYDSKDEYINQLISTQNRGFSKYLVRNQGVKLVYKHEVNHENNMTPPFYVSGFDLI